MNSTNDLDFVYSIMSDAREHGLETEVVLWALYALQGNPKLSIEQALIEACLEWDIA